GAGNHLLDLLAPLDFQLVGRAKMRSLGQLRLHGLGHFRMAMPQDERAVPADVIDVLVAVDVPLSRAGRAINVDRVRLEITRVVRYAAGEQLDGPAIEPR